MIFLDEAKVEFRSGKGGSGAVSFHREKFVQNGGPDGADGGHGGSVYLVADRNQRTLYEIQRTAVYEAESGVHGITHKRGKNGKDIEVKVPVGTIIYDDELCELITDMNAHGKRYLLCKGGKSGRGNAYYANSVRQAPNFAQRGGQAEIIRTRLELKLMADVGLIGMPNAGKSTLISQISAAKPKIADYPFTTIVPNLGVVFNGGRSFVVADTPGLIEGAAEGVGLGHQFLKHIERNRILVHVIDAFPIDESDPVENYQKVEQELRNYSEAIFNLPRIIAINKIDILPQGVFNVLRSRFEGFGHPVFAISAATSQGLPPLLFTMQEMLDASTVDLDDHVIHAPISAPNQETWWVTHEPNNYKVHGKRIENLVEMTDLDNEEALAGFQRRLIRIGVIDRLKELGAAEGDSINIGDLEFEFKDEV